MVVRSNVAHAVAMARMRTYQAIIAEGSATLNSISDARK